MTKLKFRLASLPAAACLAVLSGCAATPPSMAYMGHVNKGELSGAKIAVVTTVVGAKFGTLKCTDANASGCRTWAMPEVAVTGAYNKLVVSALQADGAEVTSNPADATLVVRTTIRPMSGHSHLVLTHYRLGKTMAMALIPLTHSRYYLQTAHLVDDVTIEKKGIVLAKESVPLQHKVDFTASTLEANTTPYADVAQYRDLQSQAVAKVLAAVEKNG